MPQSQYVKLADIYDYLMAGIDYEEWADYLEQLLERYSVRADRIADLACGTGNTTLPLAARGYEVYGIDIAPAMLAKARQKAGEQGLAAVFLEQDMRDLELPVPMDLVTSYHDGLNYIISPDDLCLVFKKAYRSLRPGGLFIFDMNAVEKLSGAGGDTTFADDEDMSLIWETSYDREADIWEIRLTGFVKQNGLHEKQGGLYEKFVETHREKAYKSDQILGFLREAGFVVRDVFHGFSFDPPRHDSRRIFYAAQKNNQGDKTND
ncbi:class I SAM-dependent DNA methyltransferase [Phosphitispora fastidiosa]|uniref:class I SAM-dependent DNA methyltransferase n=1 Tax=Phosphitispora fastidiosa TaxID=2837202 RepID=UPI001E3B85E4|nr:class I SAM-dependent methyltransferase [Phosphitispora fastidiosa]MBU7008147.1 SAM-dependent methyltransferase [Phosphitispora fastidiosa]